MVNMMLRIDHFSQNDLLVLKGERVPCMGMHAAIKAPVAMISSLHRILIFYFIAIFNEKPMSNFAKIMKQFPEPKTAAKTKNRDAVNFGLKRSQDRPGARRGASRPITARRSRAFGWGTATAESLKINCTAPP